MNATLLLVDDAPENLEVLTELLQDAYRLKVATSGRRALQIAASPDPPDLILLDVHMPELDGYETCRLLKAEEATRRIPVIFLTGSTNPQMEARGLALGANDYITKPISPAIVRTRVKAQLAGHACDRMSRVAELLSVPGPPAQWAARLARAAGLSDPQAQALACLSGLAAALAAEPEMTAEQAVERFAGGDPRALALLRAAFAQSTL